MYESAPKEYSPLYGRGSKVTILVGRHFQSEILPIERASKKRSCETFLLEIGDLMKSAVFWLGHPSSLRSSSISLLPREAQNLLHSRIE